MINRLISIFGVLCFFSVSAFYLYATAVSGPSTVWVVAGGAFAGWLLCDFTTGLVHWFGDRFFAPDTPILGSLLIFPFREHHDLPKRMTEHDFFELCGTSGLLVSIFYGIFLWARGPQADFMGYFIFFFGIFGFLTNLFHRWAHEDNVPKFIAFLQKYHLILNPELHHVHHVAYDKYYCVTHGHMNKFLDKIHFFEFCEKCLFFLPHVNDTEHAPKKNDKNAHPASV